MQENKITFTYNWNNKLGNNVFTTVRIKNPEKYKLNEVYDIILSKSINKEPTNQGKAKIVLIQDFLIDKVTEGIALIDTGYSRDKFIELIKTMYKNAKIDFTKHPFSLIFLKYV